MKTFILPISRNYVKHWGLWEAIRELLQNAYDQRTKDGCEVDFRREDGGDVIVSTSTGELLKASLVLGNTDKADDSTLRGKFGEGYKLALLVLTRMSYKVEIYTAGEVWKALLEHNGDFDSEVLTIRVEDWDISHFGDDWIPESGVTFRIGGISLDDWLKLAKNIRPADNDNMILYHASEKGRVYVGGLYVCTMEAFHMGYAFKTGTIPLDRDRGMVDQFNLSYATSKLWAEAKTEVEAVSLMMARAPDVEYVQHHARLSAPIVSATMSYFEKLHPGAHPVATQEQVEEAIGAGKKWVMVPEMIRNLIAKVKNLFIPTSGSPVERLKKFKTKYYISEEAQKDLDEIILALENK